jgi:hypothetical protein
MRGKGPQRNAEKERFWREAICRRRRSGQSVRGSCRNETLSEPSFYAWRRELKQRDDKQPVGRSQRGGRQRVGHSQRRAARRPAVVAVQLAAETGDAGGLSASQAVAGVRRDARAAGDRRRTAVGIERSSAVDHRQVQDCGGRARPAWTDGYGVEHRRVGEQRDGGHGAGRHDGDYDPRRLELVSIASWCYGTERPSTDQTRAPGGTKTNDTTA